MNETQCKQILDYIVKFGSITPLDAFMDIGCLRLSARIADLRHQGYNINTKLETAENRFGKPVRYARYSLQDGEA